MDTALKGVRVCDLSGQLAGAGATRTLAAFGAEVIRVEDPIAQGRWDILRGAPPFPDERRSNELGGAFNNHNVGKLGVTLNLRTERGRELLAALIGISDVLTENFAAEVLPRWGFTFDRMKEIKPDIIYVSNCGFGHTGPYAGFRTWGPIVQALCGLTATSGLRGLPPAGWGYSYMDHQGANLMTFSILAALFQRRRTGSGQWIDMSCVEAGTALLGPAVLDAMVNNRPSGAGGDSNRGRHPDMSPHGIYPAAGTDAWVAVACRDDRDWQALAEVIGESWARLEQWGSLEGRRRREEELDRELAAWTAERDKFEIQAALQQAGVPAAAVQRPDERIDADPGTAEWGLWPQVEHPEIGTVRVDGIPIHLSETDWTIHQGAPLLGQHNDYVFGGLLGLSTTELEQLGADGVI